MTRVSFEILRQSHAQMCYAFSFIFLNRKNGGATMGDEGWTKNLGEAVSKVWQTILEFLPNLIAGLFLVLLGWILARILESAIRRVLVFAQARLHKQIQLPAKIVENRAFRGLPKIVGRFVFWIVFLFFISAGIEVIGLDSVSSIANRATSYLPRVLTAVVILVVGILLAEFCRGAITRTAKTAGIAGAAQLGKLGQGVILLLTIMVAVDEVGIENTVLLVTLSIVIGSLLGAVALAFGLGARTTMSNIIAAHYVNQVYKVGDRIRIADCDGQIQEITQTSVILDSPEGRVVIPALRFSEEVSFRPNRSD